MLTGSWVCFDCKLSVKRDFRKYGSGDFVTCSGCGKKCYFIGLGLRSKVPRKAHKKGWKDLKKHLSMFHPELKD